MKSMCHEVRRSSPSVTVRSPASRCSSTTSRIASSSTARRPARSSCPDLNRARASARRAGRRRLPTWSARTGGAVRAETLACDAVSVDMRPPRSIDGRTRYTLGSARALGAWPASARSPPPSGQSGRQDGRMFFFSLSSWQLALIIFAVVGSATLAGHLGGRYLRKHSGKLREPFGVVQGALLGVVGLILAFGLSLAVGRYEDRRAATVAEASAIGTTYLRAQLLAEPARRRSLELLRSYTDQAIAIAKEVPKSAGMRRTTAAE